MNRSQLLDNPGLPAGVFYVIVLYIATKTVWRLCFHPLSKYPGPKIWAATSLINTYHVLKSSRVRKISELHNKYGPIIRVGPNEISYIDERAWKDIYSSHKPDGELQKHLPPADKNMGYGIFHNHNDAEHSKIRKLLSTGFSERATRDREGIIQSYISILIQRFEEKAALGEKLDATWWFDCLGADIQGHFVYGESFNALETSTLPPLIEIVNELLKGLSIGVSFGQYPVIREILEVLRKFSPFEKIFIGIVKAKFERRKQRIDAGQNEDIQDYYSLLTRDHETAQQLGQTKLSTIAGDLILAGSDTTATGLTIALYLLLQNPSKLAILSKETRSTFESEEEITMIGTNGLKYQSAVIAESMRLYPAGPETTRRITTKGGNIICGQFVPGGTLVGVYHWAAGHYKAAWKDADSFVPERWLGDERYKDDARGVQNVWNAGPRNCIGQNFAMAHIKLVLARIIWRFDMELCKESENLLDVGISVLSYHKGPLMIKLNSIREDKD